MIYIMIFYSMVWCVTSAPHPRHTIYIILIYTNIVYYSIIPTYIYIYIYYTNIYIYYVI